MERYHPFARSFHKPDPGRITSWEEPSRMAYHYWSPLASRAYAWHQLKVLLRNIPVCLVLLTSLEVAWLIPAYYLLGQIPRKLFSDVRWSKYLRVLLVPTVLALVYLPTSVNLAEQRFFYAAFPFLFAAVAVWDSGDTQRPQAAIRPRPTRTWWLAVLGAVAPLLATAVLLGNSTKFAGDWAADLAPRIQREDLAGPVAGSGLLPGGRAGLYIAFLLNQPWYGDEPRPTPESFLSSGARLMVVLRQSEVAQELAQDSDYANCDTLLFESAQQAARCPLKVFEIKGWQNGRRR
jgi:hypothetical protein